MVPLILSVAAPAFALIPVGYPIRNALQHRRKHDRSIPRHLSFTQDEEDEELLSKAKANRKAKLSAQKETTRSFLKVGMGDRHDDASALRFASYGHGHFPHHMSAWDSKMVVLCDAISADDAQAEGLTDKALELELISVQKAIYNLAKAGSQLEAGDMRAAVGTLTDTWATPFTVSVAKIGGAGAEQISAKFGVLKVCPYWGLSEWLWSQRG